MCIFWSKPLVLAKLDLTRCRNQANTVERCDGYEWVCTRGGDAACSQITQFRYTMCMPILRYIWT